jgi:hypothetical protein
MKRILPLLLILSLGACTTIPDISTDGDIVVGGDNLGSAKPVRMPDLPDNLKIKAKRLPDLTDTSVTANQLDAVDTDIKYNNVAFQVNALINAWECVMKNMNDNKDASSCFKDSE